MGIHLFQQTQYPGSGLRRSGFVNLGFPYQRNAMPEWLGRTNPFQFPETGLQSPGQAQVSGFRFGGTNTPGIGGRPGRTTVQKFIIGNITVRKDLCL